MAGYRPSGRESTKSTAATVADLIGGVAFRSRLVRSPKAHDLQPHEDCDFIDLDEKLGEGTYGQVCLVQDKASKQKRVMKTAVRPDGWSDELWTQEAELLECLDHPHVVRIYSWFVDDSRISIIMELCSGGELMDAVNEARNVHDVQLSESWAACCIRQAFVGLAYVHAKGIVHKDIKSPNVLLLNAVTKDKKAFQRLPHIVICDFGLSEVYKPSAVCCLGNATELKAGTPFYMAPEIRKGSFGPKSDVWSMGCVMFELLSGQVPFRPLKNDASSWAEVHIHPPNWNLLPFHFTDKARKLNESLLSVPVLMRADARGASKHDWLKKSLRRTLPASELSSLMKAVQDWSESTPAKRALSLKMAAGCRGIHRLASKFAEFDSNFDGVLDIEELLAALRNFGCDPSSAAELSKSLDVDSSGCCSYLVFSAACLSAFENYNEMLLEEFKVLDTSSKSYLTKQQLDVLLAELRPLIVDRVDFKDVDTHQNGKVSSEDFLAYFARPHHFLPPAASAQQSSASKERSPTSKTATVTQAASTPTGRSSHARGPTLSVGITVQRATGVTEV